MKTVMEVSFSGPLPPPEMLGEYEKVLPGAADRIICLAEKEQDIRGQDNRGMIQRDKLMIFGSVLVSLAIVIGIVFCAYFDKPYLGIALVVGLFPSLLKGITELKKLMSNHVKKID